MAVLVVDANSKQVLVIARSLGRKGIAVDLAAESPYTPSFYSRYCRRHFQCPNRRDKEKWLSFLLDLVKKERYEFILTCEDNSTRYLSEARKEFEPHTRVPLPSHEVVQLTLDKAKMTRFAEKIGVPVPRTIYASSFDAIEKASRELENWPIVLKYPVGYGSVGVRFCHSRSELKNQYDDLIRRFGPNESPWLVQQCVQGDNFGNHYLCHRGKILALTQMKLLKMYPIAAGNTAKGITMFDPEMERISERLLTSLQWHGVACFGFKYDNAEKRFIFMEINPRFGGALYLHVYAGVDYPYLLYQMVTGKEVEPNGRYRRGVRYHSIFEENLQRAFQGPRYFLSYLWDCLDPRVKSEINFSDLGPLPYQLKQALWRIQKLKKSQAR